MTKEKTNNQPVLVTTAHRGVFFGYLIGEPSKERLLIKYARNCVGWSADVKGFAGLASTGPTAECKIGPRIPRLTLFDITSVAECTHTAVEAWEQAPWG